MIISNPPYIAETEWQEYAAGLQYEPHTALVSGVDGLMAIRDIIQTANEYLKVGGYLLVEHGYSQGLAVRGIFIKEGYAEVRTLTDLSGLDRATIGFKS